MGKGANKSRRKGKKRGGDSSSGEEDGHAREEQHKGSAPKPPKSPDLQSLSFAQRRTLQKQQAADKRRQKLKCYNCGQTGHVRRECPGILDDGAGESKYTGKRQSKTKKPKSKTVSQSALPLGFSTLDTDDPVVFVDACCNLTETLRYLVTAHICTAAQAAPKHYASTLETACQSLRLGGRLSRTVLRPGVAWRVETKDGDCGGVWYTLGLHRDFLLHDVHKEDASLELQKTVQHNSECVVGVFADLDYSKQESTPGYDRDSQLRRMRAIIQVAGVLDVCWQTQSPRFQDESYETAMIDLKMIVQEGIQQYPNLSIHICSWSGSATDMVYFLELSSRLYVGMDGSVSFQKATHLHECAFDIPLDRLLLETGHASKVPSGLAHARHVFCHSGMIPWIAQAIGENKKNALSKEDGAAIAIARIATANTLLLYPQLSNAIDTSQTTMAASDK